MEVINKEFVEKRLSSKSALYIINDLFQNTQRIEMEMESLNSYNKEKIFICGDLNQRYFELYIIMNSLLRRIRGTRERIRDMYIEDKDMINLLNQRNNRLQELESDWKKVRQWLYMLLETDHFIDIERVKNENPSLLKKEFSWSEFNAFSGYEYVFFKERKFGMTNHYAMGGD